MATTSDIRNGLCIRHNNDIFKIVEFLHVKPGKGPAFVRTKLKSLSTGKLLENTFIDGVKVSLVGRNLAILYKKAPHIDPETGFSSANGNQGQEFGQYPSARNLGFNVNLQF